MPGAVAWQCPICLDTLAQPVLATCCGQSFCKDCLDGALAVADACPMCREPLLSGSHSMTRNRALEEILARLAPQDGDDASDAVLITIEAEDDEDARGVQKTMGTGAGDTGLLRSVRSALEATRSHLRRSVGSSLSTHRPLSDACLADIDAACAASVISARSNGGIGAASTGGRCNASSTWRCSSCSSSSCACRRRPMPPNQRTDSTITRLDVHPNPMLSRACWPFDCVSRDHRNP